MLLVSVQPARWVVVDSSLVFAILLCLLNLWWSCARWLHCILALLLNVLKSCLLFIALSWWFFFHPFALVLWFLIQYYQMSEWWEIRNNYIFFLSNLPCITWCRILWPPLPFTWAAVLYCPLLFPLFLPRFSSVILYSSFPFCEVIH